jgi:hypothetical protein
VIDTTCIIVCTYHKRFILFVCMVSKMNFSNFGISNDKSYIGNKVNNMNYIDSYEQFNCFKVVNSTSIDVITSILRCVLHCDYNIFVSKLF